MEGVVGRRSMAVSLMVLFMVVVAQGRAELDNLQPNAGTGYCAKRCGLKCVLKIFPPRVALCLSLCMVGCKLQPSQPVFQCTTGCAHSMINSYNPSDAQNVEDMVGSCYESCKQNNNA